MMTPKITLRQYAILSCLLPSAWARIILTDEQKTSLKWHTGERLRKKMRWSTSQANFCLMMQRLARAGLVSDRYVRGSLVGTTGGRKREYCITAKGRRALDQVNDFVDHFGRRIQGG